MKILAFKDHKIVIYDVSVKSEILFCKWGRLGNERSEMPNT
jgi:hypothetical protein